MNDRNNTLLALNTLPLPINSRVGFYSRQAHQVNLSKCPDGSPHTRPSNRAPDKYAVEVLL